MSSLGNRLTEIKNDALKRQRDADYAFINKTIDNIFTTKNIKRLEERAKNGFHDDTYSVYSSYASQPSWSSIDENIPTDATMCYILKDFIRNMDKKKYPMEIRYCHVMDNMHGCGIKVSW